MDINTVTSLAVLKVNWDNYKKDYIENFVPFVVHLFYKNKYTEVKTEEVVKDFENEYGLCIPYFAMITILRRVKTRGYINQEENRFFVVSDRVMADDFSVISADQTRNLNQVLSEFINYALANFRLKISEAEALTTIISFLNKNDFSFLFATDEVVVPRVINPKSHEYAFASFIQHIEKSNSVLFNYVLNLAVGHILANTILYQELPNYQGNQTGVNYFLDAGFIFSLIGVDGKDRQNVFVELVKSFLGEGVKLNVFQHTLDEAIQILESSIKWIDNPSYDPDKAGKTTRFLKRSNKHESDIKELINNTQGILEKNGIEVAEKPPYDEGRHNIDEAMLRKYIVDTYKINDPEFEEYEKDATMQKDIDSISAIYRLRKGSNPPTINRAKHLFVTTNRTLSKVAAAFHKEQYGESSIPACSTDLFMGTLVWLKSPAKVVEINQKKLISDCYAALRPGRRLIRLYVDKIKELKQRSVITEEEYYILRGEFAIDVLEEKTFGDIHNFSDKTPEEILEKLKLEIRTQEAQVYKSKEVGYTEQIGSLESELKQKRETNKKLATIIEWFSKYFSGFIVLVLVILLAVIHDHTFGSPSKFWRIMGVLMFIADILFGITLVKFRDKIKKWISKKLRKFFNLTE